MEYSKMMGILESAKEKALQEQNIAQNNNGLSILSRNMKKQLILKKREESKEQKPIKRDRYSVGSEFEFNLELEKESSFDILNSSMVDKRPRKFSQDFQRIMNHEDVSDNDLSHFEDVNQMKTILDSPENNNQNLSHEESMINWRRADTSKSGKVNIRKTSEQPAIEKYQSIDSRRNENQSKKIIVQRKYIYYDKKGEIDNKVLLSLIFFLIFQRRSSIKFQRII